MRSLPRRLFLLGMGSGAAWLAWRPAVWADVAASPTPAANAIRVRLFASGITRVMIGSDGPLRVDSPPASYTPAAATFDTSRPGVVQADGATVALGADATVSAGGDLDVTAWKGNSLVGRRRYSGSLAVRFETAGLTLVNLVDLESYTASVLTSEVSPSWHPESLKAQAIVVRTYALAARARSSKIPTRSYDVTDDTSSQVYVGSAGIAAPFAMAAKATAGNALFAGSAVADVYYSAACGGHTASVAELTGHPGPDYLGGVSDLDAGGRAYCASAPYYQWKNEIPLDAVARVVGITASELEDVLVESRWPDGRVRAVRATRVGGDAVTLDGHVFYRTAAAALGYKVIPSALFDLVRMGDKFELSGRGLGHGVGMCQWGARGRADAGATAAQILAAYFPGTTLA